ncbi:emopamil-binding family protein [Candidatus Lokiarchaeum ossiferum]|uniref:emopamil-binding family protein n=1 Tax=Candidatus Lokiarchaeum ossiferum TaxID=2951803 RepID=UPI00352F9AA2
MSENIPLHNRIKPMKIIDLILIVFFAFNLVFISYLFDIEQLVVLDHSTWGTSAFVYPSWPPKFIVDLNHWVGANFDPALLERPVWWRATIWIDVILFGPFYAVAIFAFIKGKNWIRIPSIMWASIMLTNVSIILFTEFVDPAYAGNDHWWVVILANLMWILMPILVIYRIARYPTTFEAKSAD